MMAMRNLQNLPRDTGAIAGMKSRIWGLRSTIHTLRMPKLAGRMCTTPQEVAGKLAVSVGERRTDGRLVLGSESPTKDRRVRFAIDMPTAEPTEQDRRAPIKMVGGRAWSPGIYRSLRLLGKSLDVAWERAFVHPLTFN